MLRSPSFVVTLACGLGCSNQPDASRMRQSRGPDAQLVDSVTLMIPLAEETGRLIGFDRAADGRYVVVDRVRFKVLVFDAAGSMLRSFQTRPRPGLEGEDSSAPFLAPGDSLVLVHDWPGKVLRVFGLDGQLRDTLAAPIRWVGPIGIRHGDSLYLSAVAYPAPLVRWYAGATALAPVGATPPLLLEHSAAFLRYGVPGVSLTGNGFVVALPTERGLRLWDAMGITTGGIMVPATRRRETPTGLVQQDSRRSGAKRLQLLGPNLRGLSTRPDGAVLVHHLDIDQVADDETAPSSRVYGNFRYYLSVISPDLRHACVDGALPTDPGRAPQVRVQADTVEVIVRRDTLRSAEFIRIKRYIFSTGGCDWLETKPWKP